MRPTPQVSALHWCRLSVREASGACAEVGQVDSDGSSFQACLAVSPSGHHFVCSTDQNHVKV